jgi:hypothetical protein
MPFKSTNYKCWLNDTQTDLLLYTVAHRLLYTTGKVEVSDTVHLFSMDERKNNLMHVLYIFIVAVGDALHVSGVCAHRQER